MANCTWNIKKAPQNKCMNRGTIYNTLLSTLFPQRITIGIVIPLQHHFTIRLILALIAINAWINTPNSIVTLIVLGWLNNIFTFWFHNNNNIWIGLFFNYFIFPYPSPWLHILTPINCLRFRIEFLIGRKGRTPLGWLNVNHNHRRTFIHRAYPQNRFQWLKYGKYSLHHPSIRWVFYKFPWKNRIRQLYGQTLQGSSF